MAEPERRTLKPGERVPFVAYTPEMGIAEFRFCLRYVRGKLTEVLIEACQPEKKVERFRLSVPASQSARFFMANAWTHQRVGQCWTWRHFWCPEHRCPAFDLYVPREAEWFELAHDSDIHFGRGGEREKGNA